MKKIEQKIMYKHLLIFGSLIVLFACSSNKCILEIKPSYACDKGILNMDTIYSDFITASRNLNILYLNKMAKNEAQNNYVRALQLLIERQNDLAETLLLDLVNDSTDKTIHDESKLLLESLYLAESKWVELLNIHSKPESKTDIYFSHSKAWSSSSPAEYLFPENGITVPLRFTRNGQPLVNVTINGKDYWFIIDTGAQFSMISKDVANDCGVHQIQVEGCDSKVMFSNPGIISKFKIGDAEIQKVPVMIVRSENLNIRLFGLINLMKIDGIIGWPQVKNLRFEFDRIHSSLCISKSNGLSTEANGNFFFFFRPLVNTTTSNGTPLYFWFDSGKGETSLFPRGAIKTNAPVLQKGISVNSMTTPMGGTAVQQRKYIKDLNLCITNYSIRFSNIEIEQVDNPFFDGWMGMDICMKNMLIIDYAKGVFRIE